MTTAKTARQVIDEAIQSLETYKHPHIDEAQELLSKIVEEAGLGAICGSDTITAIHETKNLTIVRTEWIAMSCRCDKDYDIPNSIIDADDPLLAAGKWRKTKEVEAAMARFDKASKELAAAAQALKEAKENLGE